MATLRIENLAVGFDQKVIAGDLNFMLQEGQTLAIVGSNGVGKSTLVKSIARLLKPIQGKIEINGQDIWSVQNKDFARKVAYLPQFLDDSGEMTVSELVMLGRNPHQTWWSWAASDHDKEVARLAMQDADVLHLEKNYLSMLSGGERQRAGLAMALAQEPEVLLLDEPTAHLDLKHQLEVIAVLQKLKRQNLSIVLVLHDLNLINDIADFVLLLARTQGSEGLARGNKDFTPRNRGLALAYGTPDTVLSPENLNKVFDLEIEEIRLPGREQPIFLPRL
jgi:iron complex transport system ATP-binding protein